ncbi:MAG: hypothetical protein O7B26_10310, partial [Planctomycetota bacterium]|nr:hypothetical protein [Planctomycetota bacterium]
MLTGIKATVTGEAIGPTQAIDPVRKRPARPKQGTTIITVTALVAIVLVATLVAVFNADRTPPATRPAPSAHYDIVFPNDVPLAFVGSAMLGNGRRAFAISPDGQTIVYVGVEDGVHRLYLRPTSGHEVNAIQGTENAFGPFFSPDGNWIGYFVENQLMKVRVAGGGAVLVTEAPNSAGADWSTMNEIILAIAEGDFLLRVSADGKNKDVIAERVGTLFPDRVGNRVLVGGWRAASFIDLETGAAQNLGIDSGEARYRRGFVFFTKIGSNDLFASRVDLPTMTVSTTHVPVLAGLRVEVYGQGQWAVSTEGTLLYAEGSATASNPMVWVADTGPIDALSLPVRDRGTFELSPDGTRLAVEERTGGESDVWVYELETGQSRKLTRDGISSGPLVWMPDGNGLIYHSRDEGRAYFVGRAHLLDLGLGATPQTLFDETLISSISADATRYGVEHLDGRIAVIDATTMEETIIPTLGEINWGTALSPLGNAVVYTSAESGVYHLYLQPVPPTGERIQISLTGGAEEPRWSPDGSTIYYRNGQKIMKASASFDPDIRVGAPEVFYDGTFVNVGGRSYDIAPDQSRALVIKDPVDTTTSLRVITNW